MRRHAQSMTTEARSRRVLTTGLVVMKMTIPRRRSDHCAVMHRSRPSNKRINLARPSAQLGWSREACRFMRHALGAMGSVAEKMGERGVLPWT